MLSSYVWAGVSKRVRLVSVKNINDDIGFESAPNIPVLLLKSNDVRKCCFNMPIGWLGCMSIELLVYADHRKSRMFESTKEQPFKSSYGIIYVILIFLYNV